MFWKIKGMVPKVPLVMLGTSFNQRFMFTLAQRTAFSGSAFLQIFGLDSELDWSTTDLLILARQHFALVKGFLLSESISTSLISFDLHMALWNRPGQILLSLLCRWDNWGWERRLRNVKREPDGRLWISRVSGKDYKLAIYQYLEKVSYIKVSESSLQLQLNERVAQDSPWGPSQGYGFRILSLAGLHQELVSG